MNKRIQVTQIEHNAMYWASLVLTILFAWIVFPIKWTKRAKYLWRKRVAFAKARKQSKKSNATIYVCQWDDFFFVGTRTELKRIIDRRFKNYVSNHVSHYLDVDFRKAVIAQAKEGKIVMEKGKDNDNK